MLKLARIALERSRVTDDVGWFDKNTIGALLPETSTQGAWVYAQGVADVVQAKLGVFPEIKVYAYPTNWIYEPHLGTAASEATVTSGVSSVPADAPFGKPAVARSLEELLIRPASPGKRLIDVVVTSVALTALSPVLLATAVAMGRNFAGIHWRSDAWQGLLLGESVATAWLRAEKAKSVEAQQGWLKSFEFTSFAGERVVV